jgi:hypothetical protein
MPSPFSTDAAGRKSSSTSPASRSDVNFALYRDSIIPALDIEKFDMEGSSRFPTKKFKYEAEFAKHVYDEYLLPILQTEVTVRVPYNFKVSQGNLLC